MNAIFFASMLLMLLLALSFATVPLIRNTRGSSHGFATVPLLAILAALFLSIGLYAALGRPDIATGDLSPPAPRYGDSQVATSDGNKRAASVGELLVGLERRLQENPDDGKAWLLLAKSYDHLGRESDAAAAYGKARELGISDNELEARVK